MFGSRWPDGPSASGADNGVGGRGGAATHPPQKTIETMSSGWGSKVGESGTRPTSGIFLEAFLRGREKSRGVCDHHVHVPIRPNLCVSLWSFGIELGSSQFSGVRPLVNRKSRGGFYSFWKVPRP